MHDALLCVAESQVPAYKEAYPNSELLVHPDSVVGLSLKREWIYREVGTVFMLDDDIMAMRSLSTPAGVKPIQATDEYAHDLIDRLHSDAEDMGAYLFAFCPFAHPAAFNPMDPFMLTGQVYGHAFGIREGSKLFWSGEVVAVEDYWVSLLNAYYHRTVLVDTRWVHHQAGTFKSTAELARHRSIESEKKDNETLIRYFGDVVKPKKGTTLAARSSDHQRMIKLPF